jgi:hypothetical protein
MKWSGHAVRMEGMRSAYNIFVRKLEGKRLHENQGEVGKIILKWILAF